MNRTPEIIAQLRAEVQSSPAEDLPAIIGQMAALHAEAFARIIATPPQAADTEGAEQLLTAEEVAQRIGGDCTSRWVRDHQDQLPKVALPGRLLRFSARRLDVMIRNRSYG